jgi:hypothetical protein
VNNPPRPSDDMIRYVFRDMIRIIEHLAQCKDPDCTDSAHPDAQEYVTDSNAAKLRRQEQETV